jgi:hypothetical protein
VKNSKKGSKKIGRSKRAKDQLLSAFVRNKISGEEYLKKRKG